MFTSASISKNMAPPSRSRQHSQYSELDGEEELESKAADGNNTGASSRRKVNRTNPQLSYAYGAPTDKKSPAKKPRSSKDTSIDLRLTGSPSPAPSTLEQVDAATRYKAIKERKQQQQQGSSSRAGGANTSNTDSPRRRSARLSATGSQDGVPLQERRKAISSIEEDQAVEEEDEEEGEGEEAEHASSSASQKRRMMSPGHSRSVNAHLSSFYLDTNHSNDNDGRGQGTSWLPTSLLRGAQRPRHDPTSPDLSGVGMNSIRSSDLGDSRSHDYAEEERYARLMEENQNKTSNPELSSWSPKSWFKSKQSEDGGSKPDIGETSLEKKRRKGRSSTDNLPYRPDQAEQSDSESGTSMEGRKHSHRKKRIDSKSTARGGRDDKKIWMTQGRRRSTKRNSTGSVGELSEREDDEEEDEEGLKEQELEESVPETGLNLPAKTARQSSSNALNRTIPLWTLLLGGLILLGSFGLRSQVKSIDPMDYVSVSGLKFSTSGPQSLAEASDRIVKLETAFESLKTAGTNAAREELRLASRLSHLESETDKASNRFTSSQAAMQNHLKNAEADSNRLKAEINKLQSRMESMQAKSHSDDVAASNAIKKRLDTLENQMQRTDKQLHDISERARTAERIAVEAKESIDWLGRKLPAEVAVPRDQSSGKPSLDAATWQELRKLFITKEDSDFQSKNEKAIRSLSLETLEDRIKTGTILSREAFLQLLHSELDNVKASMESHFNENANEMQNEILAKVRAQQAMFEKSGSWKKTQETAQKGAAAASTLESLLGHQSASSESKDAIVALIEAALEIYSADRIAKRDFAMYTSGARVIPSLTSPTYRMPSRSIFSWGNSKKQEIVKPPVVALHHDSSPGLCWAFQGDDGQLGIALARKVIVSDVTVEHVSTSISLEAGSSAPRDVTIWGLVEREVDRRKLAAYRLAQQNNNIDHLMDGESMNDTPAPSPPSHNHLLLASVTYDAYSGRAIQTFPASNEAKQLGIPVGVVQVRVTSNHGNKDFTCLYRVRIHGQEWTQDD